MTLIRISRRLVAQPTLAKADVEAIYRDILAGGLGGDTYNAGVLTSTSGSLDHRNFSLHGAGLKYGAITGFSVCPVQIRVAAPSGTASYRASLPFSADGVSPSFAPGIARWSLSFGNSGPSSGTAKLFLSNGGAAESQLGAGAGQSWTNANPLTIIVNEAVSSIALLPQTQLRLELAITAGTAKDFVALIWMNSKHVG